MGLKRFYRRAGVLIVVSALAFTGCDAKTSENPGLNDMRSSGADGSGDGSTGDGGISAMQCYAATGSDWALPTEYVGQFINVGDLVNCTGGLDILHTLQDIDGDRRPDLVVVNGCSVDTNIGRTKWRVFRNTGTGFAATGSDWALPSEFMGEFNNVANLSGCTGGLDILHTLQDIDGDRRPDLVVVNGCSVDANIGQTKWRVFRNTGTGYAATGIDWALPTEFAGQFGNVADLNACTGGLDILHSLQDLDGDLRPDLVVVNGCSVDTNIGRNKWRVFLNSGASFAATGINWALPAEFLGQFGNVSDLNACTGGLDILHTLQDLDGDLRPDLVVVNGCAVDTNVGKTRWRVFGNAGTGFALSGNDWALPTDYVGQFQSIADVTACSAAPDILHSLQDLTGDVRPELAIVNGCSVDSSIGRTKWRLFRSTANGFSATASDWTLPMEFLGQFGNVADLSRCNAAPEILHTLLDLNGDQRPDLTVVNGCSVDANIGQSKWRVFTGLCP